MRQTVSLANCSQPFNRVFFKTIIRILHCHKESIQTRTGTMTIHCYIRMKQTILKGRSPNLFSTSVKLIGVVTFLSLVAPISHASTESACFASSSDMIDNGPLCLSLEKGGATVFCDS